LHECYDLHSKGDLYAEYKTNGRSKSATDEQHITDIAKLTTSA